MTRAWLRYRAAYAGLPREAWLLALVLFVNRAGTMVMPFLALYLTRQQGFGEAAAGRMVGVYGLGAVVGSYLGGRLAGRYGAIRTQTVGMLLCVPACLTIPLGTSWPAIAASLFAWSAASAAVRPANAATIAKITTHENRMRAFALQRLAANLGFSFGPAVGGYLAKWRFESLFLVDAATSLVAFVGLVWFFRWRRIDNPADPHADSPLARSPLRDWQFVAVLLLSLAGMSVFFQLVSTYPLYLRDHYGFDERDIGLMFTVNTAVIVVVEMVLIDVTASWSVLRTIGLGTCVSCCGMAILPWGTAGGFAVLAMLVLTAGEMLSMPQAAGYVANRSPRGSESTYMGWYSLMLSLASMIGPSVGGAVYQWNRDALWYGCAVVGVLGMAGFELLAARARASAHATRAGGARVEPARELFPDAAYPAAVELEEAV